jgi:hypothetical protein
MWISSFPASFVKEGIFSPPYAFGTFVKDQMAIAVWTYFWFLYSISFFYVTISVHVPPIFITMALQHNLKSGIVIPPALLVLLRIALAILQLLCLCMNFRIVFLVL